jgi:predicted PurR-regulated permease PerM
MSTENELDIDRRVSKVITDVMIRFGIIAIILVLCLQVFSPFLGIMMWALILAVALYPLHQSLAKKLKGKQGRASTTIVIIGLLLIGGPTIMLGNSFADHLLNIYQDFNAGTLAVEAPNESIKELPLVGEKVYTAWLSASQDLPKFIEAAAPKYEALSNRVLSTAASTATGILSFLGSIIIAGIMMAYGQSGSNAMLKISQRLSSPKKGIHLHSLSVGTIRSVATGVIGVAFIQALLLGVGFVFAGIPAAGVLAIIVMILGIVQLPAALISLPAIAYLWMSGDASNTVNVILTIYLVIAGLADNVLKPILLGRGVDAPMPVVLLGAIGGMIVGGIIGLFVGAVLLTIGYQVFMDWVNEPFQSKENKEQMTDNTSE